MLKKLLLIYLLGGIYSSISFAQNYPFRTISIVMPYVAGGG